MKVAIIGAGIAGLCTGIYARQNGYDAHIFEMHSRPGGLCTAWNRDGYTIDCCIHWFTGSRPGSSLYKLWDEVGLVKQMRFVDLDEFARVEFPDAPPIVLYSDLDRALDFLVAYAPEDEAPLREFLTAAKRYAEGPELPSDLPPRELMGLGTMLRLAPALLRIMPKLRKWNSLTIGEFVTRFKNPRIRQAFSEIWLPEMSAFALLATLAWLHSRQAGYPLGGSQPISDFEGWLPTPQNTTASMRKSLPGLDRFYMVGQWVAPGGGLPSGVMTGREVVQLMCHKDAKPFRATSRAH